MIEGYLAWDRAKRIARSSIRDHVSTLAVFLRQLREHEHWAPALPAGAIIYGSDYPKHRDLPPRGLSTTVMTQVQARLDDWVNPETQLATRIMIGTGLRVDDCCNLSFDCLARGADGHPYLRYWNHKMRREAYVPLDVELQGQVERQQQRVAARFPAAHADLMTQPAPRPFPADGLRLLPAIQKNPFGHKPFPTHVYNQHLQQWATAVGVVEESGQPAKLTAHRWRHTYATRLINLGVRLEVVKTLLDHATLDMASHYARLLDTTVRSEWERAQHDAGASLDQPGPLADMSWANGVRTALPNGVCGLPRQQTCPHSNKCLTCPVFITTGEHLPVHKAQRTRTAALVNEFEAHGQARLAEQNRQVLNQLDAHIARLEASARGDAGVADAG